MVRGRWEDCEVTGNPGPLQKGCQFPFIFRGRTYNSCADWTAGGQPAGTTWCSTKVDTNREHLKGFYMFCPSSPGGEMVSSFLQPKSYLLLTLKPPRAASSPSSTKGQPTTPVWPGQLEDNLLDPPGAQLKWTLTGSMSKVTTNFVKTDYQVSKRIFILFLLMKASIESPSQRTSIGKSFFSPWNVFIFYSWNRSFLSATTWSGVTPRLQKISYPGPGWGDSVPGGWRLSLQVKIT